MILLKARAYLDLKSRKCSGETVDSNDIKKHKKDILRIAAELMLDKTDNLPERVSNDMADFIDLLDDEPFDADLLKEYGVNTDEIIALLKRTFGV